MQHDKSNNLKKIYIYNLKLYIRLSSFQPGIFPRHKNPSSYTFIFINAYIKSQKKKRIVSRNSFV